MEAAGKRYIWHRSREDRFRVWNLSDLHWINKACAESEIRRDIKEIEEDPFSFFIGGGDYADFIGHTDKRFDPDCVAEWVPLKELGKLGTYGMEQIRDLFLPIKHKCLGLLLGNHELKYEQHNQQEGLHGWLCTELGAQNLRYSALFDIVFCRTSQTDVPVLKTETPSEASTSASFRVFCHHGAGYATTPGGKLNRLIGFMNWVEADVYFIGHVHDHVARKEPILGADSTCSNIRQKMRLGLISGSYLKTYQAGTTTYGEQRGYRPTSLGAAVAEICPNTREMRAAI